MSRAYTVATIALALGVDIKWIDNILSRFDLKGVLQSRQGVARRISSEGVLELSIVHILSQVLHVPVEMAVSGAHELAASSILPLGGGLDLCLDKNSRIAELETRLEYAVEAAPTPTRGRPAKKTKRGAD